MSTTSSTTSKCQSNACSTAIQNLVGRSAPKNNELPAILPRALSEPDPLDKRNANENQEQFVRRLMSKAQSIKIGTRPGPRNMDDTTAALELQQQDWIVDTVEGDLPIQMTAVWYPFGSEKLTLKMDRKYVHLLHFY